MATLRNKRKLAAVTRETQEEHPRNGQSRNLSVPRINEEYITQLSEEIEGRVKKMSPEFCRTESRNLGALSKSDDFLLNPQIETHSGTVPETFRNTNLDNQGTNEDDSQSDPHPEAGLFRSQTTQNSGPEVGPYSIYIFSEWLSEWTIMCCLFAQIFATLTEYLRSKYPNSTTLLRKINQCIGSIGCSFFLFTRYVGCNSALAAFCIVISLSSYAANYLANNCNNLDLALGYAVKFLISAVLCLLLQARNSYLTLNSSINTFTHNDTEFITNNDHDVGRVSKAKSSESL